MWRPLTFPAPLVDAEFFVEAAESRGLEQRIFVELSERKPGGREACFVSPLTLVRRRRQSWRQGVGEVPEAIHNPLTAAESWV